MTPSDDLLVHLARFAALLREHRVDVGVGDEVDAIHALTLVDLPDRAEVHRALGIAFKIRPHDRETFDTLFRSFWNSSPRDARGRESAGRPRAGVVLPRGTSTDRDALAGPDPRQRPATDNRWLGYSPDVVLRPGEVGRVELLQLLDELREAAAVRRDAQVLLLDRRAGEHLRRDAREHRERLRGHAVVPVAGIGFDIRLDVRRDVRNGPLDGGEL